MPVPPTAGSVPHVHPAGGVDRLEVRIRRRGFREGHPVVAAAGPLFVTRLCVSDIASRRDRSGRRGICRDQIGLRRSGNHVGCSGAVIRKGWDRVIAELTLTVSLIAVPAAVPAITVTTNVIVAGEPGARLGIGANACSQSTGPACRTAQRYCESCSPAARRLESQRSRCSVHHWSRLACR